MKTKGIFLALPMVVLAIGLLFTAVAEAATPDFAGIFSGKYVGKWESPHYGCGVVRLEVSFVNSTPTVVVEVENPNNPGNGPQRVKARVYLGDGGGPVIEFSRYSGRTAITYWLSPTGTGLGGTATGLATSNITLAREGNPAPSCQ